MRKCWVCGATYGLHRHHVYGGPNRKISEANGFVVDLCGPHHNLSNEGVHFNRELDLKIKRHFQTEFEKEYLRSDFIRLVGRNYLD